MTHLSMSEILADESAPEAELAKEQMSVDERAQLEDERQAQTAEASTGNGADTSNAEADAGEQTKERTAEAPAKSDDLSDLPESIRRTLEKRPEDAENWRNLREIAKDAQRAAKEAAQAATERATETARLEAELAQLRQAQATQQAQAQAAQTQATMPDPDVDPAGYVRAAVAAETERLRTEMRNTQLDTFEAQAKRVHGADKVEEAFAWVSKQAQADPALAAQLQQVVDPWDFVVQEKVRRDTLAEMGENPGEYIERIKREAAEAALAQFREEQGAITTGEVQAELAKRLPRSLAKTPGAGGQAVSDGYAGPTPMGQILGGK